MNHAPVLSQACRMCPCGTVKRDFGGKVDIVVAAGTRDDGHVRGFGNGEGFLELQQSAAANDFDLETVGRAHADVVQQIEGRPKLPSLQRNTNLAAQVGETFDVAAGNRVFDPGEIERLQPADQADG